MITDVAVITLIQGFGWSNFIQQCLDVLAFDWQILVPFDCSGTTEYLRSARAL